MKRILLIGIVLLVLMPVIVNAATYYVATDGDDSNPGTEAEPFQTVQQGISSAGSGDMIYIKSGTYDLDGFATTIDYPLIIEGEGKDSTILTNSGTLIFTANFEIRNLKFMNAGTVIKPMALEGETIDKIIVENCIFEGVTSGVSTGKSNLGTITNVRISNNQFYNTRGGIVIIFGLISGIHVTNNYFKDLINPNGGISAIVVGSNADRATTKDIVISGNYIDTVFGSTEVIDGAGREVHGAIANGRNISIIENTVLHLNAGQDHEAIYIKGSDSILAYNVVEDCGSGAGGADISIKGGNASTRNKIIGNRIVSDQPGRGTLFNGDMIISDNYVNKPSMSSGVGVYCYFRQVIVANNTVISGGPSVYLFDSADAIIADNLLISEQITTKAGGTSKDITKYNNVECLGTEAECPGLLPPNPRCINMGYYCCEACESGPQPEYDNYCPNNVCCDACTMPLWLSESPKPEPEPEPEPLEGDLNNDTRVDIGDLIIVASNFGTNNAVADTDSNGIVDIFDIVFVASRFT